MVSTRPLISKSFSPCINPSKIVSSAPITIGITVIFMFHSFSVLYQGLDTYLFLRFPSVLVDAQKEW